MKNYKIIICAFLLVSSTISCNKKANDERNQFIGTWTGTINSVVPGLDSNTTKAESLIITKGNKNNQILLSQTGSTIIPTANVSGNTYTYVEYTSSSTSQNITVSMTIDGTGTLNGNIINESGTLTYVISGQSYPGTWTSILVKQ